jgi:hypothetical protein
MPKKIMPGSSIYVAYKMRGEVDKNQNYTVWDERNPGSTLDPTDPKDKITIYERQVQGWFLEPAFTMLSHMKDQASFAILAICFSYLEGVEQYREGQQSRNRSRELFKKSFKRVFGEQTLDDQKIDVLYEQGRCGLFHDGMTRSGVICDTSLTTAFQPINNQGTTLIHFHHEYLLERIWEDFRNYIHLLRSGDDELVNNFTRMYNLV